MKEYKIGDIVTAHIAVPNWRKTGSIVIKGHIKSIRGKKRKMYTIEDGEVQQEFEVYKLTK